MTKNLPLDPRVVANEVIDIARDFEFEVTHLSLQKIVYFLHESYLLETGQPLCLGFFEAWKHGPVHPQLWTSFKAAGREPIRHHAYGLDVHTGAVKNLPRLSSAEARRHIMAGALKWLPIAAPSLVGISHAQNSPWDQVTKRSGGQREYGSRITNELILSCRTGRMVPIRETTLDEDELYEQPPTRN
ncbi:MAG: DUF4065 domain-containing protein [Nitrospiraceae bacterium]|nr:DUF4065 domain-containing protein [Nitrospiraceae bacterium]